MSATCTARDTVWTVGQIDLDELRRHHLEVLSAAAELAQDVGMEWHWGIEDPTVVLVRALSHLAVQAPDATSERAAEPCDRLAAPQSQAPAEPHLARGGRR